MSYGIRLNIGRPLPTRSHCRWAMAAVAVAMSAWPVGAPGAEPEAGGGVILRWTAPGDDHYTGRATGYDIRYQSIDLGPLDSEAEWQAAARVNDLPTPSLAGQIDSARVIGLVIGQAYYFALRAHDEAWNYSLLSNSPLVVADEMNCCQGKVGNVNGLGGDEPTISDVSMIIDHLFISNGILWCPAEADVNQSGGPDPQQGPAGDISISDAATLIDHIFVTNQPLRDCF